MLRESGLLRREWRCGAASSFAESMCGVTAGAGGSDERLDCRVVCSELRMYQLALL